MIQEREHIYVAGPLTSSGLVWNNIRGALAIGDRIIAKGHAPFIPHLSAIWAMSTDVAAKRSEEQWMEWCLPWVGRCDSLFRMTGKSTGADREKERAKARGMHVYRTISEIYSVGATLPRKEYNRARTRKHMRAFVDGCASMQTLLDTING